MCGKTRPPYPSLGAFISFRTRAQPKRVRPRNRVAGVRGPRGPVPKSISGAGHGLDAGRGRAADGAPPGALRKVPPPQSNARREGGGPQGLSQGAAGVRAPKPGAETTQPASTVMWVATEIPQDLVKRPGAQEQVQTSGLTLLGTRRSDAKSNAASQTEGGLRASPGLPKRVPVPRLGLELKERIKNELVRSPLGDRPRPLLWRRSRQWSGEGELPRRAWP